MRVLRVIGGALGTLVVFLLAIVGGVLVHMNTPSGRRLAVTEVNALLAPSFKGRIRIDELRHLDLFGISGADVTIEDPVGRPVIVVKGARARVATVDALRSALLGSRDPLTVRLSSFSADTVDVRLDTDASGQLVLADTFAPRTPAAPTPADPNARGFRIDIASIAWRHAWAHGQMASAPAIDADIDDFRGSFTYAPDRLEGAISRANVTARCIANGADVSGSLEAAVRDPSDPRAKLDAHVTWTGLAAGMEHTLNASIANDRVNAVVDVPTAEPASIRALWPASPIQRATRAHLEAHGPLADIDVGAHAALGDATLDLSGRVSAADEKSANVSLVAKNIDVHELASSAPLTRLAMTAAVSARMKVDGAVSGDAAVQFLGGKVGANDVPAASIHASGALSPMKQLSAEATVAVDEPGAPTHVHLRAFPVGTSSAVDFEVVSKSIDLDRVPELRHALRGSFGVHATGELDVGAKTVDAEVTGKADGVVQGGSRIETVSLQGHAHGPVASPALQVSARALGIVVGGYRFDSASVDAKGPATSPKVTASVRGPDTPAVDANVDLDVKHGVSMRDLELALARKGEHASITVRTAGFEDGELRVDGARVEGLGEPLTATLATSPGTLRVVAATKGIDLARVARLANLEKTLRGGRVSFDADLRLQRRGAEGRLTLDVADLATTYARAVTGHVEMALAGQKLGAKVHVDADGVGSLDLEAPEVELASRDVTSLAAWKRAWGAVDVDVNGDLAKALAMIPADEQPLSRARGTVHLKAHLQRDDAQDFTPDLSLSVSTDKLELAAKTPQWTDIDGVLVHPPPGWHVEGVDFVLDAHVDGRSGAVKLSTQLHDEKGALATIDLTAPHAPYAEALRDGPALFERVRDAAFDLHVAIPERGLGTVPAILRQPYVTGRLQADVKASGTMMTPKLDLTASLRRAAYTGNGPLAQPFDVDVTGHYEAANASASVKAHSGDRELLDLEAQVQARLEQLFGSGESSAALAWKASAHAHLTGFPMESIAALDDRLVKGRVSGDLSVVDLHANAHADAALTIDGLNVGSIAYRSASVRLKADGKVVDGSVRIDQTDGFMETKAHAAAAWGDALAPALDHGAPLDLDLSSKNFRIAVLLPFVGGTLDELDGRVDAQAHVQLDPTKSSAQASGSLALTRGTIEAAAGGGELHDIAANVKLAPDGTVTLEKLTAKGLTGALEATGTAKLDGTALRSAKAVIVIPSHTPIPLTAAGTDVGNVDGRIEVTETTAQDGKEMALKVEVPKLRVALPEGTSTNPQGLGEMPKVRIGAHRGDPRTFVLVSLDPAKPVPPASGSTSAKIAVDVHLGDVQVVRGTELAVDLDGRVSVVNRGSAQVTGQIHLKRGGTLNVQGKKFTVEDGTVTLVGADPSNPEAVVKASWTAPDGTVVYAVFDGRLKTGKVTLSSEPTLPQQEIVELLLFGTADGNQAQTPTGTPANTAIGTAGGQAAQPLNHALSQLGLGAVTANVDTTQASNPRPEVEVQIAKDISVQLAVVLGQPPPGVNPDHTLLTIDWRFLTKWSLASTVGDAGTTIFDLLWQLRY